MSDAFLSDLMRSWRDRLTASGVATAWLDVRVLVMFVLDVDHAWLIAHDDHRVSEADRVKLDGFVARRERGEPVSRIVGCREFFGRSFKVTPATLDPRPDTEVLVEWALNLASTRFSSQGKQRLLDIGTGTGAIIISLMCELPHTSGVATDISAQAISVARENAALHSVLDRLDLVCTNWAEAAKGPFDMVVTNPPYIKTDMIDELERDVRDHDPVAALDGGQDGLDCYRALAAQAENLLAPGGVFLCEMGEGQYDRVRELFVEAGLSVIADEPAYKRDLAGIVRVAGFEKRL